MDSLILANDKALAFVQALKGLDGAIPYDGDASSQVVFLLANGKTLRIGVTDNDVGSGFLWFDQYDGLKIKNAGFTDIQAKAILQNGWVYDPTGAMGTKENHWKTSPKNYPWWHPSMPASRHEKPYIIKK